MPTTHPRNGKRPSINAWIANGGTRQSYRRVFNGKRK